ncbi:MAG: PfkB family carbohydrate kinase [Planctomycetaceae bacterium]|nr:PfkB family carbohydrate kinase [Planctomycetaceae bacterium]
MKYNIAFIGHMCYDQIVPFRGETTISPGSAVLCGAMAAGRIVQGVAVITRMSPEDRSILKPMQDIGIETRLIPSKETTYMRVEHPSENVDIRNMYQFKNAGYFVFDDLPEFESRYVHLAGITDQEFTLDLVNALRDKGFNLSADMQSFVRQVDPVTRQIHFKDVPYKKELIWRLDRVKLDMVEAALLTGYNDIEQAAIKMETWGAGEIIITQAQGVLARINGRTFYETFSNKSTIGRTGRGDTTFAAYLSWRLNHEPAEALKFAAALVSIKMETPGPFSASLNDVLERIRLCH